MHTALADFAVGAILAALSLACGCAAAGPSPRSSSLRPLLPSEVAAVVEAAHADLAFCAEQAEVDGAAPIAAVTLRFDVAMAASNIAIEGAGPSAPCLRRVLERLTFPGAVTGATVVVQLDDATSRDNVGAALAAWTSLEAVDARCAPVTVVHAPGSLTTSCATTTTTTCDARKITRESVSRVEPTAIYGASGALVYRSARDCRWDAVVQRDPALAKYVRSDVVFASFAAWSRGRTVFAAGTCDPVDITSTGPSSATLLTEATTSSSPGKRSVSVSDARLGRGTKLTGWGRSEEERAGEWKTTLTTALAAAASSHDTLSAVDGEFAWLDGRAIETPAEVSAALGDDAFLIEVPTVRGRPALFRNKDDCAADAAAHLQP